MLSWLAVSIAQPPATARATSNLFSQRTTFRGMPQGPASRSFVAHAGWVLFFLAGAKLVGFLVHQHTLHGGHPPQNGARPNPSLKRSANGSPPGPVSGAGAFSTARAWRATVVSRLAHPLGLACPPSQARQRPLRLSSARSAGQVLSGLSASTSGSGLACEAPAPHRSVQLQATLVSGHPPSFVAGSTGRAK